MPETKRTIVTKAFLTHLARGGVKTIPAVGALIDEMIFGTLSEIDALEEAARVADALAEIQSGVEGQAVTLVGVLERLNTQAALNEKTAAQIEELISVVRDVETVTPSTGLEHSVERLLQHHGQRLEDTSDDLGAMVTRLEHVVQQMLGVSAVRQEPGTQRSSEMVNRISLINALNALDPVSLNTVIEAMDAASFGPGGTGVQWKKEGP